MSQFEYLKVKDVRTNFSDQKPVYGLSSASQSITRSVFNATSYSEDRVVFEINPPGFDAVLDRAILFTFEVLLEFTGADQGSPLLKIGTTDGLRAFPILSCCTGVTAQVNTQSISVQPQEWISRLTQYMNTDERQMSLSPCMLDQFQNYSDYVSEGANRNPLGLYGDVTGQLASRSSEPYVSVEENKNTTARVRVRVTEFLPISLFLAYGLSRGLTYLNNLVFTFTFSDLARMWAHASNGNTISTITASLSQASTAVPTASMTWLQDVKLPSIDAIKYPRVYDWNDIRQYTTQVGSLAPGASATVQVNSVNVSSIPKYVYLFAKRRQGDETYLTSDVNARIDNITFFLNGQPMLSQAQSVDLYQISVKNGNKQTWPQWYKYQGSVLCLAVGSDLQLIDPNDYPGKNTLTQLSATVNITNPSSSSVNYNLMMVAVIPGLCAISDKGTQLISGFDPSIVKPTDMLPNAKQFELMNEPAMIGGGFFDKLWGAVKKVAAPVAQILPAVAAATGNPALAALGTAAHVLDSDQSSADKAIDLIRLAQQSRGRGGSLMAGAPIGGALMGGRMKKKKRGGCLDCGDDDRPVGHMTNKQLLKQLRM